MATAEEIVRFFETHKNRNYIQYWNSKNHVGHRPGNLVKRTALYYPLCIIGKKSWQRVAKRAYVEITGGYNRTWKILRRKQPDFKFYFGSSWWALNRETVEWICTYLKNNEDYYKFYANTVCPDESFFQTLVMMSPYADENTDFLTYVRFQLGANSPDTLTRKDYKEAKESGYLIMRKVDMDIDDFFIRQNNEL